MFSNYQLASNYYIKYINTGCRSCALRARQNKQAQAHVRVADPKARGRLCRCLDVFSVLSSYPVHFSSGCHFSKLCYLSASSGICLPLMMARE